MGLTGEKNVKNELVVLAEKATQEEVVTEMTNQMRQASRQGPNGGRNEILAHVTEERYDDAIRDLRYYLNSRPQYPEFKIRSEKFVQYGCELIEAIRSKRSFPGWNALNMSKQKDLFEKALAHFEDLKATLIKIEAIEKEVRIVDVRSTVWVVKACVLSVLVLLVFAFVREVTGGVIPSVSMMIEVSTDQFVDFIFEKLKL